MALSDAQLAAVVEAKRLLANVGLTTTTNFDGERDFLEVTRIVSQALPTSSPSPSACTAVLGSLYHPLPARPFTAEEIQRGFDCINRQTYVHALLEHPIGSIVEYPQTGASKVFQYSLGDSHGGEPYVQCGSLLMGPGGTPASCFHKHLSCKGLKYCLAHSLPSSQLPSFKLDSLAEAKKEIFLKTLDFYCTLAEKGCAFDLVRDGEDIGSTELTDNAPDPTSDSESDSHSESESETCTNILRDSRRKKTSSSSCKGKLKLRLDEYGRAFVQCEHRKKNDRAHLILRTLDEFNIPYLRALLENNSQTINEFEELARRSGYGPLVPCAFSAPPSAQKDLCPTFDVYTPYDLFNCPRVVVICRNPHSHPNPDPVKTPPPLLEILRSLLLDLDWKLADATPRKLVLDSGFMNSFRRALGWNKPFDPPLSALHPSLGNLDHVRRYIDELRHDLFPEGTGFEGAQLLAAQHRKLPEGEQYVRCAEKHTLEDGTIFYLVICMLRSMSALLVHSKKLSLDTAFKRLSGKWQEFEMETWELDRMKSVIGTRAFTTSQSAEAHLILLLEFLRSRLKILEFPAASVTSMGKGFELWITDAHKGQALGRSRAILPETVRNAMLSLSSSQVHPDLNGAFRIIENGGRKAKAWLKDKQVGSKFALPALYQPASLIPLEIWKSAPSTTNGNEQSHRNVNRDGVNLTMLGAIMRGMQYDARAMGALELHASQGIYSRDQTATHFRRLQRSLNRHGNVYSPADQTPYQYGPVLVQTRVAEALENEDNVAQPSQPDSTVDSNLPSGWRASAARVNEAPLFTTTPLAPALHSHPLHQSSWLDKETQFVVPGVPMQVDMPSTSFQPSANGTAPDSFHSVHSQLHTRTSSSAPPYEKFSQDSLDRYLATYGLPTYSFDPTFNPHISLDETSYMHVPSLMTYPRIPRTHYISSNYIPSKNGRWVRRRLIQGYIKEPCIATGYNATGVDEDLLEGMPLLLATSRDHSITGPHPLRQHKLAVLKPTEPTDIPMALHAPRSSPVSSTHGCIWHCARTRPSTVNQHHPSQLELATKLPKEPAALAVHGLFVVRLDTAGWLWRPTKTSGGRGPSAVERYLTAFGHSEITEFYQSTTHSEKRKGTMDRANPG
ncbi:hypothetical protein B0H14DRAFT_2582749 [Mycena olivaceomarginata]|nr:hypothetical protein B0H14DRAFT_2582749 [Mycena olivaceomarginata]